jgi:hypothetical protein
MSFILGNFSDNREPYCKACRRVVSYVNASRRCDDCQDSYDEYVDTRDREALLPDVSVRFIDSVESLDSRR